MAADWAIGGELEVVGASATGPEAADRIASEAGTCRGAAAETGTPSEEVPGDTTDREPVAAAVVAPPAWDPGEEEGSVVVVEAAAAVAVGGADSCQSLENQNL